MRIVGSQSDAPRYPWVLRLLHRLYKLYAAVNHWVNERFSPAGLMILMGVPITAAMGLDTNQASTYQIFCFLVAMIVIALALAQFSRAKVTVQRELPPFASAGEDLHYWVTVENCEDRQQRSLAVRESFLDPRPSLAVFATTPEPGEARRNRVDRFFRFYRWTWLMKRNLRGASVESPVPDMPPKGRVEVRMSLKPSRRGVMRLAGPSVLCPEPFGLYRIPVRFADPATVLVLPKRYRLPTFTFPGSVRYQQGGVTLASSIGESEEFAALRDYRRGDPLSRIHWKSWARVGRPVVKEYQQEYFVRHALVLDTFVDDAAGECFEEAVSLAASLACTVDTRDSLLDLLFLGTEAHCFTAGRGVAHAEQMLELLATIEPCKTHGFEDLEKLVGAHAELVGGCICLFVDWDEQRQQLLRRLQQADIPVMVLVIRPTDEDVDRGDLRLGVEDSFHVLNAGNIEAGLRQL